ncbi:MAG TPA: C25 family cysteine peptidase, partial [Candidatus Ozemobacteraceae bacterium]|nr:C25 family cysteine peptidase [Candidatus Ozemobacteraceae bacterium]
SDMMWVTSRFGVADCKKLTNGAMQPYIIDVACVNGNFVKNAECFAEAWMRAGTIEAPAGAIGICAASTNMEWVPPCIVQAEMSSVYIAKNEYKTAGGILMNGIIKGLEQYGTSEKGSGVMMYEQWHLFGDATLNVRTNAPVALRAEGKASRADGVVTAEVVVVDAAGTPIRDARVAVYTEGMGTMGSTMTNAEGKAIVTISADAETPVYYTITGGDLVPVVDQKLTF